MSKRKVSEVFTDHEKVCDTDAMAQRPWLKRIQVIDATTPTTSTPDHIIQAIPINV